MTQKEDTQTETAEKLLEVVSHLLTTRNGLAVSTIELLEDLASSMVCDSPDAHYIPMAQRFVDSPQSREFKLWEQTLAARMRKLGFQTRIISKNGDRRNRWAHRVRGDATTV